LRHPDVAVVLAFAAIGLLAAVSLMLLFPFPDYIATALAQFS